MSQYFQGSYLELDLELSLNKAFQVFEEKADLMNKQTSREVWKSYLNKTVISIIQVLFNSFSKIKKQKSEDAIEKIQKDYDMVKEMFEENMSKRLLRPGLEVLGDIKNFFESSCDLLTISVGKMRNEHGPAFNITTVKALLSLRTDLTKQEKNNVVADSLEILKQYRDEATTHKKGVFNNVDTASALQEFNEEMEDPNESNGLKEVVEEEDIDIEDFLKQGGIDVEELDEKIEETEIEKAKRERKLKKKEKEVKKIVGREDM